MRSLQDLNIQDEGPGQGPDVQERRAWAWLSLSSLLVLDVSQVHSAGLCCRCNRRMW